MTDHVNHDKQNRLCWPYSGQSSERVGRCICVDTILTCYHTDCFPMFSYIPNNSACVV